ncbi:MAG: SxtJ family membrane protein [Nitrospirota bacterium]|nr:SxtJ family membrane protein [Nitrospirota bacterium]
MFGEIPELDRAGLRRFGLTFGGIFGSLFGVLFPWLADADWPLWPWVVSGTAVIWALAAPATLRPVYLGWMHVGGFVGRVNTRIILFVVFYSVVFPIGLLLRLLGRDPMARKMDPAAPSYRVVKENPPGSMDRPF